MCIYSKSFLLSIVAKSVTAVILHLLPHLVPSRQLQKLDSGEKIKANIAEARDAFVFHVTKPSFIDIFHYILKGCMKYLNVLEIFENYLTKK